MDLSGFNLTNKAEPLKPSKKTTASLKPSKKTTASD
jgi:hypothetical protein